ncbi:hypothetical protein CASFOL_015325 [Castilleja foliolosa]|uniref:Uncharacterized protein n=1 Tax=Castilleja foliolosa TaxID=1961234 RepID=A0ABD3DF75_9LAMI
MGRAPCCDKANVKRGPWSPDEDDALKSYIHKHGTGGNWIALPNKIGLKRCGKSCRLRWLNYLRPNIKHGGFTEEEDNFICNLYISIGSRWSIIAAQLPGRTDNDIKNYWNTRLRKKLLGSSRQQRREQRLSSTKNIIRGSGSDQNLHNYTLAHHQYCSNFSLYPQPPPPPPPHMVSPPFLQTGAEASNNISALIEEPKFPCYDDRHSQVPNNVSLCYSQSDDQTVRQQLDGGHDFKGVITGDYVPVAYDEIKDDVIIRDPVREQLMDGQDLVMDRWPGDIGCLVYPSCADICQSTVMSKGY